jgi:hypothetical protein
MRGAAWRTVVTHPVVFLIREQHTRLAVASVYLKRGTWYLSFRDASGRWRVKASIAKTKTEARRLAEEIERTFDRQARGLDPA